MAFTIPGWNLDQIGRNSLEKGLVLERDFGVMLSGRLIGGPADQEIKVNGTEMGHERWGKGFGYDIGIFNPAGRSSAVEWDGGAALGDALAYVGRIHYDFSPTLHTEAAYGVSEKAGGDDYYLETNTEDYKVWDIGVNAFLLDNTLNLKGEYIDGQNIRGEAGRDQSCWVATVGYMAHDQVELIVKHYQAEATRNDEKTDLGNTVLGVNFYLEPLKFEPRALQSHKITINYVMTSGDDGPSSAEGAFNGLATYRDDVYMLEYQYKF
jgi:hypothetical protein